MSRANSVKALKKDTTLKALPSHRKHELGDKFSSSVSKGSRANMIDKIR